MHGMALVDNLLYAAIGEGGVVILDISNPANPVHMGAYDTRGSVLPRPWVN